MPHRITASITLISLFFSLTAHAQEHPETDHEHHHSMHMSPHTHGTAWIAGFKALGVAEFVPESGTHTGAGTSLSLERNVVDGWLEVELVVNAAVVEDVWIFPIDVLFKKPFHIGPFCPYVGIGGAAKFHEGHLDEPVFGATLATGAYYWFGDHMGLDLEIAYDVMLGAEAPTQELLVAFGPAVRF